jgi:hypothetical protein
MSQDQTATSITGEQFTKSLAEENRVALERLAKLSAAGEATPDLSVERLLRVALKNELEASELAAIWMTTTSELDVKLALARQTGDEARHYRLIADRLKALGVDADRIDPRDGGYSPLFEYLRAFKAPRPGGGRSVYPRGHRSCAKPMLH